MYINILSITESATEKCPLLLETDAGHSILDDPKDLCDFYNSLPESIKKKTAICLDTCHVFSAGYDPLEAFGTFNDNNVPVKLVHFNDSLYKKGCKKDRHTHIGKGQIGVQKLTEIALYCAPRFIGMLIE